MGNVHAVNTRIGHRDSVDSPITFMEPGQSLEAHDGLKPKQFVVEVKIDHKAKWTSVTFRWIAVEVIGMEHDTLIIEVTEKGHSQRQPLQRVHETQNNC
jgi:hypothetical protein